MSRLGLLLRAVSTWPAQIVRSLVHKRMPREQPTNMTHTSLVMVQEARRFINDCLQRVGVPPDKVRCISDFMLAADYRGIHGSGINRLEMYLRDLQHGYVDIDAEPKILRETATSAHVDGNCAMGVIVGNFCMDLAVEKARKAGLGFVVAKRSQHIGMAAWYAFRAMNQGMVGLVLSNAAPMMVVPGAKDSGIGANCLAFGAAATQTHLLLDMATSVKDIGALEWAFLKNEYIPSDWASDECGSPTCFPSVALKAQRLYPIGGNKGYGLSAMIDVLCGVMSGANYAGRIPRWWDEQQGENPNLGLVMMALDPTAFVPDFEDRLEDFNSRIRNCRPIDPDNPVKLPGEVENEHMIQVDELGALPYPNILLAKYQLIASMLRVKPIQIDYMPKETRWRSM